MKITDVQVIKMELPSDVWMLLRIETDQGIEGWGEVTDSFDDAGLAGFMQEAKGFLIGKNPLHIQECCDLLRRWTYPSLRAIRAYATALSGLDQALWDVTAKYYKLPLYKLYGADGKTRIPLYANLNKAIRSRRTPDAFREQGELALQSGFSRVKCTPFDEINPQKADPEFDASWERLQALLDVIPVEKVAIDCHQRFQSYTLARMVEHIKETYGIPYWIEDPVELFDYSSMREIRRCYPTIRWAAGEDALSGKQILDVLQSGCYEIVMPDIKFVGGPSTLRALIPAIEECNARVTLHNPNGIIATAHSAHALAVARDALPLEFPLGAVPERGQLCTDGEPIENGTYVLSDRPGIGVELSEQALKEYGRRFTAQRWEVCNGR